MNSGENTKKTNSKISSSFVKNEWDTLKSVIVGIATSWGPDPSAEDAVDPKSREHILAGTYPLWSDVQIELDGLVKILEENGVDVLRPENKDGLNQVFTRDVGVAIDDKFIRSSMIADRAPEWEGVSALFGSDFSAKTLLPPPGVRIEGGDIMPMGDEIWVGYSEKEDFIKYRTSRTNKAGLVWVKEMFPEKTVRGFQLHKSDTDPRENALHLDCCLCPLGGGHVIFHPEGLKLDTDVKWIREKFANRIYEIDAEAMYNMHSNLFSISPDTVISGVGFEGVNAQLRSWGYTVLEVPYNETAKMEGLLRCTTLPISRD